MKYDVFISYSRKDYVDEHKNVIEGNIVSKIKDLLKANGFTYWLDEKGISAGDEFTGIITEAIINSEIFLFISSKNSNASKWTIHEIAVAKMLDKKTIPFRVDNTIYDKSVLMYLAPLDYIDYGKNPSKAFQALLVALNNHMTKLKEAELKKQQEEQRKLRAKEEAEARHKAEEAKKKRISAIDKEILEQKYLIDKKNEEKETIQASINDLKEKIGDYLNDLKTIEENIKSHNCSIAILENEKDSLLGISKASQSGGGQKVYHSATGQTRGVFWAILARVRKTIAKLFKPFAGSSKRKCFMLVHLLLLAFSILFAIFLCFELIRGMDTSGGVGLLIPTIGAFAGIIQLLRKNRNGILILFLNGILGYFTAMFMVSTERVGWGFVFLVYQLVVFGLYKYHQYILPAEYSWANMKGVWRPTRFFPLTTLVSWAVSYIIPFLFVLSCGCNFSNYSFEQADRFTRNCIGTVCTTGDKYEWACEVIGKYYMKEHGDILTRNPIKALEWYRRAGLSDEDYYVKRSQNYIKLYETGHYISDIHGLCGLNTDTDEVIAIDINRDKGGGLKRDSKYNFEILGEYGYGGYVKVEGALFEEDSDGQYRLYGMDRDSVASDSVVISYFKGNNELLAQRCLSVKAPEIQVKGVPYGEKLEFGFKYEFYVTSPYENGRLRIGYEDPRCHHISKSNNELHVYLDSKMSKLYNYRSYDEIYIRLFYEYNGRRIAEKTYYFSDSQRQLDTVSKSGRVDKNIPHDVTLD